ncbi:MAG: cytochrome c biogenesis protein CcdA [Thermomicrobiales bacterium]
MGEYVGAFLLGNGAILGNVCVLPLYPGFIAFLGGTASSNLSGWLRPFLGLIVFAGMMTVMLALGWILFELNQTFSSIFEWFLPALFGTVIVLGIAMLLGKNPFARIATLQVPLVRSPIMTALLYGMVLGPMTLPCTGPLIVSTFVLGVGDLGSLTDGIVYFVAFGLGFGWPLVVLPFLATPVQAHITRWLARHYAIVGRLSGALLILVAVFGFWVDVLPSLQRVP